MRPLYVMCDGELIERCPAIIVGKKEYKYNTQKIHRKWHNNKEFQSYSDNVKTIVLNLINKS